MAFDSENHIIDPHTGFQLRKEDGGPVGLTSPAIRSAHRGTEYPKYVKPHPSHIVRHNEHVSCPYFPEFHVDRDTKEVTVMVKDADEEAKALADKDAPEPVKEAAPPVAPPVPDVPPPPPPPAA